jgi:hypothetical protein
VKSLLEKKLLSAYIIRPPQELTPDGCGYAVQVKRSQLDAAMKIIRDNQMPFKSVFCRNGKSFSEVSV